MKNMRLINADVLKESVRKKYAALSDRCEINELVNAAPTIDAIPVEWLKKHKTEYFEDWGDEPVTIERALIMWQKEQEANYDDE